MDIKAFSAFSKEFVEPLFPKKGEEVTLSAAFSEKPEWALIFYDTDDGLYHREPISESGHFAGSYLYSAKVRVSHDDSPFRYYFCFGCDNRSFYLSKEGITRNAPSLVNRFSLIKNLDAPSWVEGSVCYQIFPDRFNSGDPSVGAKEGEYEFDGALVTTPPFGSVPKPYEESRCIDFQNGDLKGIEDKIGYLKSLGVDVVYLNPITASMTVHRFDSIDYMRVDPKLGGDEALISLIEKLHENGIRIVVDISINHVSSSSPWFLRAEANKECQEREYFIFDESGNARRWQDVGTLVQLNYKSDSLRDLVYRSEESALKKFIKLPFNQDGWRLDVAPELGRAGSVQLTAEVWREVRKHLKRVKSDLYLVGEDWDDSRDYLEGDMWDATMNYYGSGRILRSFLGEKDRFLSSGWGQSPEKERAWSGFEAARALNEAFFSQEGQMPYFQMNLIDSHDTPRFHLNSDVFDIDTYIGVNVALFMIPGMPSIYYGDEILLGGRLHEVEGARYPMQWDEKKWNTKVKDAISRLSEIRKMSGFSYSSFISEGLDDEAFIILRLSSERSYLAAINRGGKRELSFSSPFIPKHRARLLFGHGSARLEGDSLIIDLEDKSSLVILLE